MCVPAAAAMTIGSGLLSAYGMYQEGQQADAVAKYNARQTENEAVKTRNAYTEKENDHRRQVAELMSKQRAKFGASGVDVSSGSALDLQTDTLDIGETDALRIRSTADDEVKSMNEQAKLTRQQGKNAAKAGKISAVGSLLSTGGQVAGKWYTPSSAANAPISSLTTTAP